MKEIGIHANVFFENFIQQDNLKKYDYRAISGILSLRKHYSDEVINNACLRAISYNAYSYKIVKKICEKGIIVLPIDTNTSYINQGKNVYCKIKMDKVAKKNPHFCNSKIPRFAKGHCRHP